MDPVQIWKKLRDWALNQIPVEKLLTNNKLGNIIIIKNGEKYERYLARCSSSITHSVGLCLL